jgi:hypothetical protein
MLSPALSERVDVLIDDLIMDGGVESASLASILLASKDSLRGNYLVTLSRRVWTASGELKADYAMEQAYQAMSHRDGPTDENGVPVRPFCRTG